MGFFSKLFNKKKTKDEVYAVKYTADGERVELLDDTTDLGEALFSAVYADDPNAILAALDNGADIEEVSPMGYTVLRSAAESGKVDTVRILLSRGADVNAGQSLGEKGCVTALMFAAAMGHSETVKLLIENGADVNVENHLTIFGFAGRTALKYAASKGHADVVRILLDNGADVNAKGSTGSTALMIAVAEDHADVVRILIDNGADVNVETNNGSSASFIAEKHGKTDILKMLEDA